MSSIQTNPPNIQMEEPDTPGSEEMVFLCAFSLDRQLREFLREIWFSKDLSDFTVTANGKKFKTHKFLLRAHSEYFSKLPELLSQSSAILDLKSSTLELVLTFLYLGQVKVPRQSLQDVAAAAEFFGIDLLKKQCRYALLSDADLNPENCLDYWTAARDIGKIHPAEKALKVALENFDDLQHETGFTELPLDCIQEYLTHQELQVITEDERLSAAMTWIKADKSRMQHLLSLLELLPLRDMQIWYLKQVLHSPGVRNQPEARAYLENLLGELTGKKPTQEPVISPIKSITDIQECTADTQKQQSTGKALLSPPCQPMLVVFDSQGEMWGLTFQKDIHVVSLGKVTKVGDPLSIGSDGRSLYITSLQKTQRAFGQSIYSTRSLWKYSNQEKTLIEVTSLADNHQNQVAKWSVLCSMTKKLYIIEGCQCYDCQQNVKAYDPLKKPEELTSLGSLKITALMAEPACCALPKDESLIVAGSQSYSDKFKHFIELFSVAKQQTIETLEVPRLSDHHVCRILHVERFNTLVLVAGDYTAVLDVKALQEGQADKIRYSDNYIVPNKECMVGLSTDRQYVILLGGDPKMLSPKHYYYRAPIQCIINNTGRGWEKLQSDNPLAQGKTTMKHHNIVQLQL